MSMALAMKWVGVEELDRAAETRWKCYAHAGEELARFKEGLAADPWGRSGDYLLAERKAQAVGTATSLPLTMWVRGSPISCQGVAWVGTIKSARRRGGGELGVGSAIMREVLRAAREREHVVSALMPFRVSFYERFGYGIVERRSQWTIPLPVMPSGDCAGWRLITPEDRAAQAEQWQAAVRSGQCDVERPAKRWEHLLPAEKEEGMVFIDRPESDGPARGMAFITQETAGDRRILNVQSWSVESPAAFGGLLSFLGTLRDEFTAAKITGPVDWPINRLLREAQVPHRPVEHATPEVRTHTRMQLRVLDHQKFLESLNLPEGAKGRVSVGILETEGDVSRFSLEFEAGRARVKPASGAADFECADRHWAAIATGDMAASQAVRWGLARENNPGAAGALDELAAGPLPFCREHF
ncbi:MAG: GNAT family N-acetyltransferase [Tepidisphaeraceae bacterium]